MQLAGLGQLEMASQIIDGSLDLQRQRVELVGIWLMAAGEARKSTQLAGETESAPMEDQQLQLLPRGCQSSMRTIWSAS